MLKRNPSLKLRAALIFTSIYSAVFLCALFLLGAASLSSSGERHHAGPQVASVFAVNEFRQTGNRFHFKEDGRFVKLAARNPSLWLLADFDGKRLGYGPVPDGAVRLFDDHGGVLDVARLHMAELGRPWSDTAIVRSGGLLLASGGVDPETISAGDAFHYFIGEGLILFVAALGILGVLALLVALPLLTSALKPVTEEAGRIGPERPDARIGEDRVPSELLPLVRGFNAALDRLSDELARRKRFIADVAHELRTPLAIASLQVESLEGEGRKADLQRVVGRMSDMVAQMLDVERLSLTDRPAEAIDLEALARDVVADMAPMAMAAGYELSLDSPRSPVVVEGDPQALSRAITNLVGNAVAHGGGAGTIRVVIGGDGTLDVIDEGPGIPESVRPLLFEPFFRSRWDRDGCGLGLHLTREIMRSHGGEALLLDSDKGSRFRLRFPDREMRSGTRPFGEEKTT